MDRPWDKFTTQKEWKAYLQELIRTNDQALYRAILLIDARQTDMEKAMGATFESNKRGFGASHAPFLTNMALRIRGGAELTPQMKAISRNMMVHYWKQLYHLSLEKQRRERDAQGEPEPGDGQAPVED